MPLTLQPTLTYYNLRLFKPTTFGMLLTVKPHTYSSQLTYFPVGQKLNSSNAPTCSNKLRPIRPRVVPPGHGKD
eukprot:scaffold128918_cov17-Prasinocladus_malaysianus.AAC.1